MKFIKHNLFGWSLLVAFFILLGVVVFFDKYLFFDLALNDWWRVIRNDKTLFVFLWFTHLGKWKIIFSFSMVFTVFLFIYKKYGKILSLLAGLLLGELSVFFLKILVGRERPLGGVYLSDSFSFPSNHTTLSVIFYGFIVYILVSSIYKNKLLIKIGVIVSGGLLIVLIAFSRLYLSMHYLTDVFGGLLLGGFWLWFVTKNNFLINLKGSELLSKYAFLRNTFFYFKGVRKRWLMILLGVLFVWSIFFYFWYGFLFLNRLH
jgi:undecaprenyl-diphosphatase